MKDAAISISHMAQFSLPYASAGSTLMQKYVMNANQIGFTSTLPMPRAVTLRITPTRPGRTDFVLDRIGDSDISGLDLTRRCRFRGPAPLVQSGGKTSQDAEHEHSVVEIKRIRRDG